MSTFSQLTLGETYTVPSVVLRSERSLPLVTQRSDATDIKTFIADRDGSIVHGNTAALQNDIKRISEEVKNRVETRLYNAIENEFGILYNNARTNVLPSDALPSTLLDLDMKSSSGPQQQQQQQLQIPNEARITPIERVQLQGYLALMRAHYTYAPWIRNVLEGWYDSASFLEKFLDDKGKALVSQVAKAYRGGIVRTLTNANAINNLDANYPEYLRFSDNHLATAFPDIDYLLPILERVSMAALRERLGSVQTVLENHMPSLGDEVYDPEKNQNVKFPFAEKLAAMKGSEHFYMAPVKTTAGMKSQTCATSQENLRQTGSKIQRA
jgi:hypothetical protein